MSNQTHSAVSPADVAAVSPTLAAFTGSAIVNNLWQRQGLSTHDRCVITVAALIARAQTAGMAHYFNKAMDNGVSAEEMSEIVLHMAFYAGWSNAFNAVIILKDIFAERGIDAAKLPVLHPEPLPLAQALPDNDFFMGLIDQNIRPFAPGLADFSTDLLYHHVWQRPGLSVRDRNLISITALIVQGLRDFLGVYMARGIQQGISRTEMGEVITHLAFYAGWPTVIPCIAAVQQAYDAQ
ncbi:carboxymuconolactone decarboxylase family protein [Testudinibacter sp. TR-2022]|uniref:carboxymuconolactone decarboxylase family protein n=1 Tax=Testudinibacter sp. TR-2022 TaxID=2585029 RepID=UPI001119C1FE|nr:carboxymuconolactone decarboxylase family protein [Testudinibacter sp. TR-2022]TNH04365.1 carboxymuconolactone decarboxylase family protein [Pasteurellaceae bacterium Phil11]TNH23174.1 carboxymuconolactone decarboxylase family protein [Testudinibacter sp. TR-2022]TNH23650.1 carboxymuconolactone decarboxylase family protein [Testudinibacter sp. TR-2022]